MSRPRWGVYLQGEPYDLDDWRAEFKRPFDPWIVDGDDGPVLCSKVFEAAETAEEVRQTAGLLMDVISGALIAKDQGRLPVSVRSVVEFQSDGRENRYGIGVAAAIGLARARAVGVALGLDGEPIQSAPHPSDAQRWLAVADSDKDIYDALTHFSRGDNWFDIYKTVECLEARFGGQHKLKEFPWASNEKIGLLKQSANLLRHARPTGAPPKRPMPLSEAKERLGRIVRGALGFGLDQHQKAMTAARATAEA